MGRNWFTNRFVNEWGKLYGNAVDGNITESLKWIHVI